MRDRYEIREFSLGEEAANDLLVADGEQAVEFQSKALQLGAGRRVPPNSFAAMARPVLEWVDRHDWRGVIRLVCDSRLNDSDAVRLSKRLIANLEDPARFAADIPGFSVDLDARSANVPVDEVNVLISPDPERPLARPTVAMIGNRDEVGLRFVLRASSRLDDRVIGKMLHEAVTAAQQLRGDVPGVVAVHTPEPVNWSLVQEAGVLDRHVSNVIATGNLDAASAIVFTSEDEHEAAYVYKNLRCQRTLSPGFRVFGADSPNADGGSKK